MRYLPAVLALVATTVVGCKSEQKNRNDAYVPGAQQCVTATDSACTGEGVAGVQMPLPEAKDPSKARSENTIFGHCELEISGEEKILPCDAIKLVIRATRENEERSAVFNGFDFRFEDLNQETYNLVAASPKYDLTTDTQLLKAGQTVKIHVRAKKKIKQ